ncbi:MAG: chemotaxis protein CheW [Betaproteobacteria bacterium]|nr:chemotaxis protein CheW [Betaproteobacteria bacterium]
MSTPGSGDGVSSAARDPGALHERLHVAGVALERAWTPDRAQAERILKARARQLARPAAAEGANAFIDVLAFRLGAETYAVEPQHVARVHVLEHLTPLPGLPAFVLGIARVRGEIVSVLDLRSLFELPERGLGQLNRLIVLQSAHMRFGLLADAIEGMRRLPRGGLVASLPTLEGVRARYLLGVSEERIVVLDAARLLADERLVIDEGRQGAGAYARPDRNAQGAIAADGRK